MEEESAIRGNIIYKEGEGPIGKVYLIKSGEFQLSKSLIKPTRQFSAQTFFLDQISKKDDKKYFNKDNFSYRNFVRQQSVFNPNK